MADLFERTIIDFFTSYLKEDVELYQAISNAQLDTLQINHEENSLIFTLPTLFKFMQARYSEELAETAYLVFRKMLYTNPTNTLLKQHGGEVVIHQANDDHDLSLYKLVRL